MDWAIETSELTRRFGDFTAVDRLTIRIPRGRICGFLGPNGAGKSTAVRMLCGILAPTSGRARVLNLDLESETDKIKERIGYMSQKFSLYSDLTVVENLEFYAGIYGFVGFERAWRIQEITQLSGLEEICGRMVSELSVGLKQRLALGCALFARPEIVFLDEPTSGVSPSGRRRFFNIIQDLAREGTTVIVTTHFMDEAERCDQIAFINVGRLIAFDTPEALRREVMKGYLAEVESDQPLEMADMVSALPYVRECRVHGTSLHVMLETEARLADLERITGSPPRLISPSLDDVFVTLARREGVT